ncbi:9967_t:CDS:2, partial [Paraglomus occultum]
HILGLSIKLWSSLLSHASFNPARITHLTAPHIHSWFSIVMTPLGTPIDRRLLFIADGQSLTDKVDVASTASSRRGRRTHAGQPNESDSTLAHNIDIGMLQQDFALVSVETVIRGRIAASKALGMLISRWPNEALEDSFKDFLLPHLASGWASNKQLSAVIIEEWARASNNQQISSLSMPPLPVTPLASILSNALVVMLESDPPSFYHELVSILRRIRGECQALLNTFISEGRVSSQNIPPLPTSVLGEQTIADASVFSIEMAKQLTTETFDTLTSYVPPAIHSAVLPQLQDRKRRVLSSIAYYQSTKQKTDINVNAACAGAVVSLRVLPPKLNPIIRSIMSSIKNEENAELQERSAASLASLVAQCAIEQNPSRINPNDKIVKNLCTFLCSDQTTTPVLQSNKSEEGILSLQKAKEPEKKISNGAGGESAKKQKINEEEIKTQKLIRRGAETALKQFAHLFDEQEKIDVALKASENTGQEVIDSLQILQSITPVIHESLHSKIAELLPCLVKTIQCKYSVIRHVAARCFATIANVITIPSMQIIIEQVLPFMGDSQSVINRQGAAELIYHLVQTMDAKILPYVIFLVVPILGRMSDVDESVRLVTTNCFAMLIKLVPLEAGIPNPPGLSERLTQHRYEERKFLSQLLDSSRLDPYEIPVTIKAELRKYQQEGVNWLAFLNKYQLHGILCDDMGLGKTLQSICILASDHHARAVKYETTKSPDCSPIPSLVVCPPTLTGHWYHELLNYTDCLKPLLYTGGPKERERIRPKIMNHDVVIMSYDIVRNDIDELADINWNYCILDEGHIIKNGKTKITKAVKAVKANHRLILSGTPIQNNVLELWSLFDFLMPGFLGTEKQFNERFGKPILASRDSKSSSKEQEA